MVVYVSPTSQLHGGLCVTNQPSFMVIFTSLTISDNAGFAVVSVTSTSPVQLHGGRLRRTAINLLIVWLASVVYSARILIELLPSEREDFELEVGKAHGDEHDEDDDDDDDDETCILFIEADVDDVPLRGVDLCLLYVVPIAIQIFCYVRVARKLWSSQVRILTHIDLKMLRFRCEK